MSENTAELKQKILNRAKTHPEFKFLVKSYLKVGGSYENILSDAKSYMIKIRLVHRRGYENERFRESYAAAVMRQIEPYNKELMEIARESARQRDEKLKLEKVRKQREEDEALLLRIKIMPLQIYQDKICNETTKGDFLKPAYKKKAVKRSVTKKIIDALIAGKSTVILSRAEYEAATQKGSRLFEVINQRHFLTSNSPIDSEEQEYTLAERC